MKSRRRISDDAFRVCLPEAQLARGTEILLYISLCPRQSSTSIFLYAFIFLIFLPLGYPSLSSQYTSLYTEVY